MNRSICSIAAALLVPLAACEDGSVINQAGEVGAVLKPKPLVETVEFAFTSPYPTLRRSNEVFEVSGEIGYWFSELSNDADKMDPNLISLGMYVNATLKPPSMDVLWGLSTSSEEAISVSEEGVIVLDRRYAFEGRTDGLTLGLRLGVSRHDIQMLDSWLELPPFATAGQEMH